MFTQNRAYGLRAQIRDYKTNSTVIRGDPDTG